jgi:hypothetical protein
MVPLPLMAEARGRGVDLLGRFKLLPAQLN